MSQDFTQHYYISVTPLYTEGVPTESDQAELEGWRHEVMAVKSAHQEKWLRDRGTRLYPSLMMAQRVARHEVHRDRSQGLQRSQLI